MTLKFYHIPLIALLTILFSGCSKGRLEPEQGEGIENLEVVVLFSPEGFYNLGYNDRFLAGLEKSSSKYGFSYSFHVPDSAHHGIDIYKEWLTKDLSPETQKSLFIFSSNIYEEIYNESGPPAEGSAKEVLIFDIPHAVPNAYSIHVATYGAAYYSGMEMYEEIEMLSFLYDDFVFHLMLANDYDLELKRTYDGFVDAINAFPPIENVTVSHNVSYIHEVLEGEATLKNKYLGYRDESYAYMAAKYVCLDHPESFSFLLPIAGASNQGVYRYSNMNLLSTISIGMYVEDSFRPYTIVKRMDIVLDEFFNLWSSNGDIPEYKQYSLGSEGVVVLSSVFNENTIDEEIMKDAIIKEKEYYEKLAQ